MSDEDIELPPLPKASKMYDIPGYDEEELKDYARTAIQADRVSRDPSSPAEDGCHCATCTCNPSMTPAVRFDLSPAQQEGAIRDHLIRLGWTPPGSQQPASVPVRVTWAEFWIAKGDWETANDYAAFEKAERWLLAQQPAITHCDNCGCDWLDNGLNPVGCPYCKQHDARGENESNYPIKYYKQGAVIYAVHGTSSINCVERLLAKIADLESELENERTLRTAALDTVRAAREGRDALREALEKIRKRSSMDYMAHLDPFDKLDELGKIHQIADDALAKVRSD